MKTLLDDIPQRPGGGSDWKRFFSTVTVGDEFILPIKYYNSASALAGYYGHHVRSATNKNGTFTLFIVPQAAMRPVKSAGPFEGLSYADLRHRLNEATENIAYWTQRKVSTALVPDRAAAGARILAWQQTRNALHTHLLTLSTTES